MQTQKQKEIVMCLPSVGHDTRLVALEVDAASVGVLVSGVAADGLVVDALTLAAAVHGLGVRANARGKVAVVARQATQAATVSSIIIGNL